jgi:hypothetical protein
MPSFSGVWNLVSQYQAKASLLWPQGPGAPTSVSAAAGDQAATVSFTAPTFTGVPPGITGYLAISSPGGFTATGASSPLTVTGLTNGTAYTFSVQATNSVQYGPAGTSGSVTPSLQRGLFMGGDPNGTGTYSNVIDYISISTTGNAIDFGDLTLARFALASCASTTRACAAGGEASGGFNTDRIDFVTIASTGNATTFGNLGSNTNYGTAGCNSSTRGVFAGGLTNWPSNVIEFITIASAGNSSDFGDLTVNAYANAGCSSSTRGLFAGGFVSATPGGATSVSNVIGYITIASTGNAIDFGDLTVTTRGVEGAANSTRALFAGGLTTNVIGFVTIASTGNATDFGDLLILTNNGSGSAPSSPTRAVFMGANYAASMDYVTITSAGNALNFGDLSVGRSDLTGTSNCNGGVQ